MFVKTFFCFLNIFLLFQFTSTKNLDDTKLSTKPDKSRAAAAAAATTTTLNGVPINELTRRRQFLYHAKEDLYKFIYTNHIQFKTWGQQFLADPNSDENHKYKKIIEKLVNDVEEQERALQNVTTEKVYIHFGNKCAKGDPLRGIIDVFREVETGNNRRLKLYVNRYFNRYGFGRKLKNYSEGFLQFLDNLSEDLKDYIKKSTLMENRENKDLIEWQEEYEEVNNKDVERKTEVLSKLAALINYI